jgi:ribosomal-protein-alanine N-acetyltransferase
MIIRKALKRDLAQVIEVNKQSLPENYPMEFFEMTLKSNPKLFLVAKKDRKIVGYIMSRAENSEKFHVISLAVLPEYRHKHVATKLLDKTIKTMSNPLNVFCVYLEVRQSNFPAISLYKKFGFEVRKSLERYYNDGENAYLLLKTVVRG